MATVIGTNVVTDGSTEIEFVRSLLNHLEQLMSQKSDSDYAKNLKALTTHLNGGGKLEYKLVENKYLKEFETYLKDAHIPYILMPNENGQTAIVTRDSDRMEFLNIQKRIFSKQTDYWKEQAMDNFLDNIHNDPKFKYKKISVLKFQDNEMRLIASDILFQNDIVTSYSNGLTAVHPSDKAALADAELDYALEQAKKYGIPGLNLLAVRKSQAKYDQEVLSEFCKAYAEGKQMNLFDANGLSTSGLAIDRNGNIVLVQPENGLSNFVGPDAVKTQILIPAGTQMNETELYSMLSRYSGNIRNKVCVTNADRDRILTGEYKNCPRPKYKNQREQAIVTELNSNLIDVMNSVKRTADNILQQTYGDNLNKMDSDRLYDLKKTAISQIINDRSNPLLQNWLATDTIDEKRNVVMNR